VVTDDCVLARDSFIDDAAQVLAGGGSALALHIRGPRTTGRSTYRIAAALLPKARQSGATLLVNDRVDVALILGVDGVHLGRRSLPPTVVRDLVGHGALVGTSVEGSSGWRADSFEGADFAFVGTLFPTESHPGATCMGIEGLPSVVEAAGSLPVIGIGGICVDRVSSVLRAGAYGVAAIRGIWSQPDLGLAVQEYLGVIEGVPAQQKREA
jgi:thiamine-phosphate pyrophosphorylase